MENYGFVKVAAAAPMVKVADCKYNSEQILELIKKAEEANVAIVVFPELSITAYTCSDLFNQQLLLKKAEEYLLWLCEETKDLSIIFIVGLPITIGTKLYNTAAVCSNGKVQGIVPKTFIPNYGEFYEKRWFAGANDLNEDIITSFNQEHNYPICINTIFEINECRFAIEICEDLWTAIPPSSLYALNGADVIFNLSASNEIVGKHAYRKSLISQQSARCISGYIYASASCGESTTDLVYAGACTIAENGKILAEGERYSLENQLIISDIDIDKLRQERLRDNSFSPAEYRLINQKYTYTKIETPQKEEKYNLSRVIHPSPFVPNDKEQLADVCQEILAIQTAGLIKRMRHINAKDCVIGISGGLDSTLALLVLINTYDKLKIDRKHIWGITMPGFGTSNRTYNNAIKLMQLLGISIKEISIADSVIQHFKDIDHDIENKDVVYENSQARERTQILMDFANKVNGLVIGTGDLSELALGWCTYNGDHMSMYGLNASVPKTLVRALTTWVADNMFDNKDVQQLLHDIVDTPVSPELLPANDKGEIAQVTEDAVGPYILHDFFLFYMLRYGFSPAKILFLANRAFKDIYDRQTIITWMKTFYRRFFTSQFKRSCLPDGPKVGSVSLSPRGDWRMPSDASYTLWMEEIDKLM